MNHFDQAFEALIGNEGGYSNHPDDPGGATNWGITEKVAREYGYTGSMKDLSQDTAKDIYRHLYWLGAFDRLPYSVAFQLFDGAVNSGVTQSVKWLQQALGVTDDGILGPITMRTAIEMNPWRLTIKYNAIRLDFLTDLKTWPAFGKGWARRIANNLTIGAK
jgi:lysozyme family protein